MPVNSNEQEYIRIKVKQKNGVVYNFNPMETIYCFEDCNKYDVLAILFRDIYEEDEKLDYAIMFVNNEVEYIYINRDI